MQSKRYPEYQHVILVSIDDLRADCVNSSLKKTRFLDFKPPKMDSLIKIIEKGTYFQNCISAAPYTTASHGAYFTGCWPINNGIYEFFNRKITKPTIFELAKSSGHLTIFQTDFPIILGKSLGLSNGVEKYFVEDEKSALRCLLKNRKRKTVSFFHFGGVHYPYGFHKLKFSGEDYVKKVEELEKKFKIKKDRAPVDTLDESIRDKKDEDLLIRYKRIIEQLYEQKRYAELLKLYSEGITYFMEKRFNKFIEALLSFVDQENALLVVFSDHGEDWSDESKGHSNSISDAVLRVPLIFYGNGVPHMKSNKLVRTIDLAPTICAVTKIRKSVMDGKDLGVFENKNQKKSRTAFAQVWRSGDKKKVKEHQKKILAKSGAVKPIKTYLEKEAVYSRRYALDKKYNKKGILLAETLFINSNGKLKNTKQNRRAIRSLNVTLKKYKITKQKKNKLRSVKREIVRNLNLLGYDI